MFSSPTPASKRSRPIAKSKAGAATGGSPPGEKTGNGRVLERLAVAVAGDERGRVAAGPGLVLALEHQQPRRRAAGRELEGGACRQVRETAAAERQLLPADARGRVAVQRVQERLEAGRDRL